MSETAHTDIVLLDQDGPVVTLTVNRPEALNALNEDVLDRLLQAFGEVATDPDIRAVVLTGAGDKAFVAGADISAMAEMGTMDALAFADMGHVLGEVIEDLPQPVIAAVNGYALGGGCELALSCDFILASDKALFGQPEVGLGLIPGFGGTQRLGRRIPAGIARELVLTGRMVKAEEAVRIGLANAVHPASELLSEARKVAASIASKAPLAVQAAKRAMRLGADRDHAAAMEIEKQAFAGLFSTQDALEGMAAFMAKRDPSFQGE